MNVRNFRFRPAAAIPSLLLILLGGCGAGDAGPDRGEVTGIVTLDGIPVKGAIVEFVPEAPDGVTSYGGTDEKGHYEMLFGSNRKGSVLGRNRVRITSDDHVTIGDQKFHLKEVFPPKYNIRSEQYVDVQAGSNEFNFELESEGFDPRRVRPM